MNEQLLLSKAFWSIDEFNQATINLWELKSRIDESLNKDFESPTERITKVDLNTYIDSIIVFIESLPKFIGLFDTFNSPVYRGIDLGKSYEFFKQIFYTYCYIIIFGKEFKIIIGQELLHRISLDKYLSEYINAYKLGTTNYSMLFFFNTNSYDNSLLYKKTGLSYNIYIPLLTIYNEKIGYHQTYTQYSDFDQFSDFYIDNYKNFDEYLSPLYNSEKIANLITQYEQKQKIYNEKTETEKKIKEIQDEIVNLEKINDNISIIVNKLEKEISKHISKFFGRKKAQIKIEELEKKVDIKLSTKEENYNKIDSLNNELSKLNEKLFQQNDINKPSIDYDKYMLVQLQNFFYKNIELFDYEWSE